VGLGGARLAAKYALVEIDEGCVCCSMAGQIKLAISQLKPKKPDSIVLETTGVANPFNILSELNEIKDAVNLCAIVTVVGGGDFLCREWYADIHPFLLYGNIRAWVVVFEDNGAVAGDVLSGSGEPFLHEPVVNAVKVSVGAAVTQYGVAPARDFARLERGHGVCRRDRGSNVFFGVQRVDGGGGERHDRRSCDAHGALCGHSADSGPTAG